MTCSRLPFRHGYNLFFFKKIYSFMLFPRGDVSIVYEPF